MAASGHIETEIKIRWTRPVADACELFEGHGYRLKTPRTLEADQLFDRNGGELYRAGQILRLRRAGARATVTYKGPFKRGRHKSREEIEFDVSNPSAFESTLSRLGYEPGFGYEKYRTTYSTDEQGIVTIDETPIGVFLEFEGPPEWIDRTTARMGFAAAEYLTMSYATLYQDYRRKNPGASADMKF
jgi:adenylate cyclase, class 2